MATSKRGMNLWLLVGGALVPIVLLALPSVLLWSPALLAAEVAGTMASDDVLRWAFASAAAATGISSMSAGYAVAQVGSAGIGALAEKPDLFGRILVLVGLAEGIAIYGLIISILILNQLG